MMQKIHTISLRMSLSLKEFYECKNMFYTKAIGHSKCCFPEGNGHKFLYWSSKGAQLHIFGTNGNFNEPYLDFRINPSKLIGRMEPQALYEITEENNQLMIDALAEIMKELPIVQDINRLSLQRLDICKDYRLNWTDICLYIGLLNKGIHDPRWQEETFGDERDHHSFRRISNRYQITVYDKVYQLQKEGLIKSWDEDYKLLRIEVALKADGISHMTPKYQLFSKDWNVFLLEIAKKGDEIFLHVLSKILPEGHYYSLDTARDIILDSDYYQNKKEALIDFLTEINMKKTINLHEIRRTKNGRKRLLQLKRLQINPVTIAYRKKAIALPSLFSLINPSPVLADEMTKMSMYCSKE